MEVQKASVRRSLLGAEVDLIIEEAGKVLHAQGKAFDTKVGDSTICLLHFLASNMQ